MHHCWFIRYVSGFRFGKNPEGKGAVRQGERRGERAWGSFAQRPSQMCVARLNESVRNLLVVCCKPWKIREHNGERRARKNRRERRPLASTRVHAYPRTVSRTHITQVEVDLRTRHTRMRAPCPSARWTLHAAKVSVSGFSAKRGTPRGSLLLASSHAQPRFLAHNRDQPSTRSLHAHVPGLLSTRDGVASVFVVTGALVARHAALIVRVPMTITGEFARILMSTGCIISV